MSRILRRPMFRGGSTSNEGIMSVPRKGYEKAGGVQDFDVSNYYPSSSSVDGGLFGNNEDAYNEYVATSNKDESLSINPKFIKSEAADIKQKNKTYKALGQEIEEGSYGDVLLKEYLGNRPDPMGKFLINFGLNYMSARPRGGKFGALTTAAEAAKKPTEQLYADQDTEAALELKLLSAFGKEKDTDAMKIAKAYAQKYGGTAEDYLAMVAKRKIESSDLKDYSDVALIRKYGEDWGKENKVNSAIQRLKVCKFRLRLEKGEVDKEILGNLPSKGSEIMITEDYTPKKDNSKLLEINPQAAQDYQTGKIYVNPIDKQFYIVQGEGNKKTFVGIDKYY